MRQRQESAGPRPRSVDGRKIRIDANPPGTPGPEPGPTTDLGALVALFRSIIGVPGRDRRGMPRHDAGEFAAWLGWWRRPEEFRAIRARLVNISRGGALLRAADPPPERQPVWLCLGRPEPEDCIAATVLAVKTVRRRECALRLAFPEPCPTPFLEAAVFGLKSGPKGSGLPRTVRQDGT